MAKGSRLGGVANGLLPRRRAGILDRHHMYKRRGRPTWSPSSGRQQALTTHRPASAGVRAWCQVLARPVRWSRPGNPCASRMIPLESPVPEIGTPGSESGGRKRAHGTRPAARRRKRRTSHRLPTGYAPPLDSTRMLSVPWTGLPDRVPFDPDRFRDEARILDWEAGIAILPAGHAAADEFRPRHPPAASGPAN